MRSIRMSLPAALVMGTALLGCGTAATTTTKTAASTVGCSTQGATAVATTKSYRVVLDVRPASAMYAPGQVTAGVTTGDIMYAGSMTSASGPDARNLNVHICKVSDNQVLSTLKPVITLKDTTTGATQAVPYATMQGVGQTKADFHYGNTLSLAPGDSFTLTASVGGQTARLSFTEPKTSTSGAATSTTMGKMNMSTTTTTTSKTARATSTTMGKMAMSTTTTTMAGSATSMPGSGY